jgi:hypothetical protein
MDLGLFLIGPPVVCLLILAALPAGAIAFWGHMAALVLWGLVAIAVYPLRPASGPDDWYHGIEIIPHWGSLFVLVLTGLAQFWRWHRIRSGHRPFYVLALLVLGLAMVGLFAAIRGV